MTKKFFNTAGPIIKHDHYFISSRDRIDWEEIITLIDNKRYFLLHAPRQTGKTSALLELMEELNLGDKYACVYMNIEGAQAARNDIEAGISTVCSVLAGSAEVYLKDMRLWDWFYENNTKLSPQDRFKNMLAHWSQITEKPIVLLIDEVDALIGDTLVSLLRQLRAGYNQRPEHFPGSVLLCGVRDIKDYRIHKSDGDIITGGSAFNIKAKSLTIGNFTFEEMKKLLLQHTELTGQKFADEIWDEMWEDTAGQPWLVNALAHEMTYKDREARDPAVFIIIEKYFAARERLILSRATHLDQLADKLKEPRIHKIVSSLLSGEETELQMLTDDMEYAEDMGLIKRKPQVKISNRIYKEIIPRELISVTQDTIVQEMAWYQLPDRRIDMTKLMQAFQQFFRENSEMWIERFQYKEAGPQLLMQAFLQRLINGGGRLNREYALGRRRTDLLIEWPLDSEKGFLGPVQRIVIELKIRRGSLDGLIEQALEQTADYADKAKADEAHIVIFNRDKEVDWDEKIWEKTGSFGGRQIQIWGC